MPTAFGAVDRMKSPNRNTECIVNSPLTESFEILLLTADVSEIYEGIIHGLWHIIQLLNVCCIHICMSLTCQQVNVFFHNSSLFQQVSKPVKWHGLTKFRVTVSNYIKSRNVLSYAVYPQYNFSIYFVFLPQQEVFQRVGVLVTKKLSTLLGSSTASQKATSLWATSHHLLINLLIIVAYKN